MCHRVNCRKCGKPTYAGCGRHVEAVLADVPLAERCRSGRKAGPRLELGLRWLELHRPTIRPTREEAVVKATIESAGGVASRVRVGSHELTFDQTGAVPGGEDRGPSPLDVMAIAVGACAH